MNSAVFVPEDPAAVEKRKLASRAPIVKIPVLFWLDQVSKFNLIILFSKPGPLGYASGGSGAGYYSTVIEVLLKKSALSDSI